MTLNVVEPLKRFTIEVIIVDSASNAYKMMNSIRRKIRIVSSAQNIEPPMMIDGNIYEKITVTYEHVSSDKIDALLTIAKKTKQLEEIKVDGYAI